MTERITDHVTPAASTTTPHVAPERVCRVCEERLPAGIVLHPGGCRAWAEALKGGGRWRSPGSD